MVLSQVISYPVTSPLKNPRRRTDLMGLAEAVLVTHYPFAYRFRAERVCRGFLVLSKEKLSKHGA